MKSVSKSFKMVALVAATTGMVLSSCGHESIYDPDYANKVLQQNWKEKMMDNNGEIDPNQNWSMAQEVQANIAIFGMDALSDYKLKLFTDNPLVNERAELIASVAVKTDGTGSANVNMPVDVKKGQTIFYACYEDSHNRRNVKPVGLINGEIDAIFGKSMATRGSLSSDGLVIPQVEDPSNAVNAQYAQAVEVNSENSVMNWSAGDGFAKVLKIGAGNTWTGAINVGASENELGRTIYVDGTWDLSSVSEMRLGGTGKIVVRPGGKIVLGNNTKLVTDNRGRLVVMAGASIMGPGLVEFANGTGADFNYNAGTINVGIMNNNGGDFYNYGDITVQELAGGAGGSVYVNWGKMFVDHTGRSMHNGQPTMFNASNMRIKNACQLEVTHSLFARNLDMGEGSYTHVGEHLKMELAEGGIGGDPELLMAKGAQLLVDGGVALNNVNIVGPTDGWAICQFGQCGDPEGEIEMNYESTNDLNVNKGYVINNLYISIDRPAAISDQDYYNPRGNAYLAFTHVMMNGKNMGGEYVWNNETNSGGTQPKYKTTTPVGNGNAHLVNKGEANIVIPEGCAPAYNPIEPDPTPEIPQTFIFACEDLGTSDDFDFNDVVFSVSHVAGETKAVVTVLAAGGTLDAYIEYDNNELGEVHSMLGAEPGMMTNTSEKGITHTHAGKEISVAGDWTLANSSDKFRVRVVNLEGNSSHSEYVEAPKEGEAPQMIILPSEWEWPTERTNIKDAYPGFVNWVKDATISDWNATKKEDLVVKRK